MSSQLRNVLSEYDADGQCAAHSRRDSAPFFRYKHGGAVKRAVLEDAFLRLRRHVHIGLQNVQSQPAFTICDTRSPFIGSLVGIRLEPTSNSCSRPSRPISVTLISPPRSCT